MIAAVVEPDGLNPNWSSKFRPDAGWCRAGYMYCRTRCFSNTRDNTGVTEIGLRSPGSTGFDTFGTIKHLNKILTAFD